MSSRIHKCCLNYHGFLHSLLSILHNTPVIENRTKKRNAGDPKAVISNAQRGRCYFFSSQEVQTAKRAPQWGGRCL